jgi:LysR family transcriptional regulator for metE and metH
MRDMIRLMRNDEPRYDVSPRALDLEVRHLRLVAMVAEHGSLTRAAERLNLTQSALSHQLLDIEERLGTQLFHRVSKKMVLTPAGTRIHATAVRVLRDLSQTEEDVRLLSNDRAGAIRFTTECYTCYHWLPPLMKQLQLRHPSIELHIDPDASAAPIPAIVEGRLDFAIMSSDIDDARIEVTPLFEDEIVLIVAPKHPLTRRDFVRPGDFARETFLTYSTLADNTVYQRMLRPAGVTPRRHMQVRLTEAMVEMAAAGAGVAALANWAVTPYVNAGIIAAVPLSSKGLMREWKAATLRGARRPSFLEEFISLVADAGTKLSRGQHPRRRAKVS